MITHLRTRPGFPLRNPGAERTTDGEESVARDG